MVPRRELRARVCAARHHVSVHGDGDPAPTHGEVRQQALFWLAQKAGEEDDDILGLKSS